MVSKISNGISFRDVDRNTTYFYTSTIICQKFNRIEALKNNNDEWIFDQDELKNLMVSFFKDLYTITDEVVISSMGSYKAPGLDGFQAIFFQRQWDIVQYSFCEAALKILRSQEILDGLNETFLVLIPKVDHPENVSQFRPISLCNVLYKTIIKAIVNRLKKILPNMISPTQGAFVPGRQITDNIVIVQEALHLMRQKRGKKGYMAIKIDLAKAYDRLR
ncbi:retrovirus-related pol polyprotein LINE-1 [Tanacetum coccineum]|uniref:Retrovirus-related pol polyprotein LINE-1 n=1 Tax=Tanacetum coccineum TaxID=301880 RepID=A0ABQ5E0T5_9ASTR